MLRRDKNPIPNNKRAGIAIVNKPTSIVAEQIRTIRTNIKFSMVDSKLKSLLVTSAGPGSGKSLLATNIAAAFASEGKKVLLVDVDLRKPTVHKAFNLRNNDGLTSLLTDEESCYQDVIYRTAVSNLSVLTSGVIPPNPAELLSSDKMEMIKKEFENSYDLVIYDSPPLMAVTDAQIMASKTDGTLFIIPYGKASKEEVIKSKKMLEMVNANVIGAILNRVKSDQEEYYYYAE